MKRYGAISLAVLPLLFAGCASHMADPRIDMAPPAYVEELPPRAPVSNLSNPGSLYGRGDNPLFSDRKAMNTNDIVTVVISESLTQSSKASKNVSKKNADNLGGGIVAANTAGSPLASVANSINKYTNIGFETSSSNTFTGSGSNSRNESFTTTISARIIKVMNNGNYFIEGSRELLLNGEKQIVQISGVIRPYDISQYNQIDSKFIADAKIMYTTQGDIERASTQPWGSKLFQSVWPF
ncbi:MAG: flagellar basal body L-ring protein FlgH [Campylobacterales bacterium]|nr:flagellar basal body L-ring protein FlgH [Campylobacterales bacterium]